MKSLPQTKTNYQNKEGLEHDMHVEDNDIKSLHNNMDDIKPQKQASSSTKYKNLFSFSPLLLQSMWADVYHNEYTTKPVP